MAQITASTGAKSLGQQIHELRLFLAANLDVARADHEPAKAAAFRQHLDVLDLLTKDPVGSVGSAEDITAEVARAFIYRDAHAFTEPDDLIPRRAAFARWLDQMKTPAAPRQA